MWDTDVSMVHLLQVITVLWLCKEIPWFLGNTHRSTWGKGPWCNRGVSDGSMVRNDKEKAAQCQQWKNLGKGGRVLLVLLQLLSLNVFTHTSKKLNLKHHLIWEGMISEEQELCLHRCCCGISWPATTRCRGTWVKSTHARRTWSSGHVELL